MITRLLRRIVLDARHILSRRYMSSVWYLTQIVLKRQYRESFLGMLWSLIQPSIHILVLTFVFSYLMRAPVKDYSLYVMGGILPWTLMVTSFNNGSNALTLRAFIIRGGCVLPKTMFIVSDVLVCVYVFFLSYISMYCIIGLFTWHFSGSILLWPLVSLPLIITCICAAIALAYMAPYVRDVSHLITILMNALFWTVPIAYPLAMIPKERQIYFDFHPLYILIRPIQMLTHDGVFPPPVYLMQACGVMLFTMVVTWAIHHKLRRNVVYYL